MSLKTALIYALILSSSCRSIPLSLCPPSLFLFAGCTVPAAAGKKKKKADWMMEWVRDIALLLIWAFNQPAMECLRYLFLRSLLTLTMLLFIAAVQLQNLCMLHTLLNVTLPGIWSSVWLWEQFCKHKRIWSCFQLKFHLYGVYMKVCNIFVIATLQNIKLKKKKMQCRHVGILLHLWNMEKRSQVGFSSICQHTFWHYKHWLTDLGSLDRHLAECWKKQWVGKVKVFLGESSLCD